MRIQQRYTIPTIDVVVVGKDLRPRARLPCAEIESIYFAMLKIWLVTFFFGGGCHKLELIYLAEIVGWILI